MITNRLIWCQFHKCHNYSYYFGQCLFFRLNNGSFQQDCCHTIQSFYICSPSRVWLNKLWRQRRRGESTSNVYTNFIAKFWIKVLPKRRLLMLDVVHLHFYKCAFFWKPVGLVGHSKIYAQDQRWLTQFEGLGDEATSFNIINTLCLSTCSFILCSCVIICCFEMNLL